MKSNHRFPLRRQIVWGMRFFTILTSLAVGAALFTLSNQYVRANSLQAADFNLRLVATSIETSLDSADALLNWASIDSTVRRYISQENINGTQTIAAYEAVQEKYYSSTLYSHILRFFITNENDRHLQFGTLNSSAALNRTSIKQFLPKGYGMQFTTDPLLPGSPDCIALSQPVRCGKGTLHRGSTYLALNTAIITDPAAGYNLTDGSALYWEMGSRLWQIENGSLTEIENPLREVDYTLRTGSNNGVTEQTAWQGKVQLDGQKYYVVKVTLNGRSAALVQLLPANTFLLHYGVYLWLITLGIAIIWGLSFLMQHWLEWVITRPVEALQKRIETVGSGNFAPDRTVEWNNELGDIGRGINQLAENVDSLMTRRVEDERRKQELEYRMLQNEVNPHFIYNTLNSIRWMATIQHAPGIAEMVTAFARLTKSISKGTQKLVPLQEELALLNDYFTIQQYRYGGDLEIEVSRIESETLCQDCMIPRFTLQPLVENAIFHGLEPKGGHGSVLLDISTDPDTGDVLLRITDDGVGMPPEQVAHLLDEPAEGAEKAEKFRHVGLWNVNRRIRYSFGEGYGLTIESEEDVGTEVTIRLPYQQKGDSHAADITGGCGRALLPELWRLQPPCRAVRCAGIPLWAGCGQRCFASPCGGRLPCRCRPRPFAEPGRQHPHQPVVPADHRLCRRRNDGVLRSAPAPFNGVVSQRGRLCRAAGQLGAGCKVRLQRRQPQPQRYRQHYCIQGRQTVPDRYRSGELHQKDLQPPAV